MLYQVFWVLVSRLHAFSTAGGCCVEELAILDTCEEFLLALPFTAVGTCVIVKPIRLYFGSRNSSALPKIPYRFPR